MAYKVVLKISDYGYVDGEFKKVETKKEGRVNTWDDVDTFLACLVEAFGSVDCKIEEVSD